MVSNIYEELKEEFESEDYNRTIRRKSLKVLKFKEKLGL